MSKVLCTFSGKYGDVLWSLPTARAISQMVGVKIDFATMPMYKSLSPLIQAQSYIDKAFVIEDWQLIHSNFGDQPWHPPKSAEEGYERCFHLTYKGHPGINAPDMPLMDFIAYQQGIAFRVDVSPIPFLEVNATKVPMVAYAFNEQYGDTKKRFLQRLIQLCEQQCFVNFVNVAEQDWLAAVGTISSALCFVGCRSSNAVLAHGVGQRLIVYEPHPARNKFGSLGRVFGCPYNDEASWPFQIPPEQQAEYAAALILEWKKSGESICCNNPEHSSQYEIS